MKPTKLLIFCNPKAGTPLMLASPSTAIDLPLKMLVWEDAAKKRGFLTTIQNICRSGMVFQKICCQVYLHFAHWNPEESDKCALFLSIKISAFRRLNMSIK